MSLAELWPEPAEAWEPFRPVKDGPWDSRAVAHLHRRAGFGATWEQVRRDVAEGLDASIQRVLEGEATGPDGRPAREFEELTSVMEEGAKQQPCIERVQLWWLFRLLFTPMPLAEKMTLAWHSHYATSVAKVREPVLMLDQNKTIRNLWRARISQLHEAMLRDPAMLNWLDGAENKKDNPNENLGREFLELFALGEGNYSEQDVRECARALTGWQTDDGVPESRYTFVAAEHDAGAKTILGQRGKWGSADIVRIACRQPAAAVHIARRLYRTFISDTELPAKELLEPLARAMRVEGDVDVARGIEIVLRSRLFHSPACRGKCIRSPVELAIGAFRICEAFADPPDLVDVEAHLAKMGQRLFYPPNVAGWLGGLSWLAGSALLARQSFAATFADPKSPYGPAHLLEVMRRRGAGKPERWLEFWSTLFLTDPPRQPGAILQTAIDTKLGPSAQCGQLVSGLLASAGAQVC
jgi:uncharacterized protein (DUF1800 family)